MLGDPEVKRVLAIDDDLTTLTMISLACRAMQANVRLETASTVERANWLCRQNRYDLILLEHQLGTMTGIEWIDGIRQVLRPSTGVVVFSGELQPADLREYHRRGVLQIISKRSLTLGMMSSTLQKALELSCV